MLSKVATIGHNFIITFYKNIDKISKHLFLFGVGVLVFDYCFKKTPLYKWAVKEDYEPYFDSYFLTDKGVRGSELGINDRLVPITWPLVNFIDKAEKSLDICFYVITSNNVIESILNAKKRKINVRVIVDYNIGLYNNEHARKLLKAGKKIILSF